MNYLLDTNIIVDHLRKKIKLPDHIMKERLLVSIITYAELMYGAYKAHRQKEAYEIIESFLKDFSIEIINLNNDIVQKFGKLKAYLDEKGERLEDFDILIASTALSHSFILVTRNLKHFKRIPKLKVI